MTDQSGVRERLVEAAAREAFWSDDIGGHHKRGQSPHTWENIPEFGRENYRRLVTDVFRVALPLIADHIEAVRDGGQEGHYELCSLTNVADMLRSWSS